MQIPPVLYKYLPRDRVDVLVTGRIRFSPPRDLDDLFESRPRVRVNHTSAEKRVRTLYSDDNLAARKVEEFDRYVREHGTEVLWNNVNETYGILSLSADPVNAVMWGLYAGAYRGYLLGFDTTHEWMVSNSQDMDVTRHVRRVNYTLDRPIVEIGELGDADRDAFATGAILTKGADWAFQQEWRMLRASSDALAAAECSGVSHLFPFPEDAIVEVVLGPSMSKADQAVLRSSVEDGSYSRAKMKALVVPDDSFKLRIEDG